MNAPSQKHASITLKLLKTVFTFYVIITVIVTVIQMKIEYRTEANSITSELERFKNMISPGLSDALLVSDERQIDDIMVGLLHSNIVEAVSVKIPEKSWYRGIETNTTTSESSLSKYISYPIAYSFSMRVDEINLLAHVVLYSHTHVIFQRVMLGFLVIIINAIIKTTALWLIFIWAGRKFLSKPLAQLTEAATRISQGELKPVHMLRQGKNTEVDVLANAFNQMVTELQQARATLSRANDHLQQIINAMPSQIFVIDADGILIDINERARSFVNKEVSLNNSSLNDLLPEFTELDNLWRQALQTESTQQKNATKIEWLGQTHYFDIMIYPLLAFGFPEIVVRIEDVSTKIKLQQTTADHEKMRSLGGLAAGMAHEMNNPLGAILQNTQNIRRRLSAELDKNQDIAKASGLTLDALQLYCTERQIPVMLDHIQEAGERASHIVTNLLRFSRPSQAQFSRVQLSTIIDKALELARADYPLKSQYNFAAVTVHTDYADNMPDIICDTTALKQVVLNIIKNAAQAMQQAQTNNRVINMRLLTTAAPMCAEIQIEDNGPGMAEEVKERIFEPFFTTKDVGEGSGLGLFVSYHIITELHHGELLLQSQPEHGTNFVIRLPSAP